MSPQIRQWHDLISMSCYCVYEINNGLLSLSHIVCDHVETCILWSSWQLKSILVMLRWLIWYCRNLSMNYTSSSDYLFLYPSLTWIWTSCVIRLSLHENEHIENIQSILVSRNEVCQDEYVHINEESFCHQMFWHVKVEVEFICDKNYKSITDDDLLFF